MLLLMLNQAPRQTMADHGTQNQTTAPGMPRAHDVFVHDVLLVSLTIYEHERLSVERMKLFQTHRKPRHNYVILLFIHLLRFTCIRTLVYR